MAAQSALTGAASILGRSDSIQAIRVQVEKMGRFHDVPVLVIGDPGTGKSLVASRIHEASCPDGPYVVLGCGTLPPQIFDRELFGYDPGAFPDARLGRPGKFEQAEGGTVVLEGVEHLASEMQGKLFSVLEAGEVKRLNSDISRPLDCRLICTTSDAQLHNQPIRFRQDLYSRISGVTLQLQPLAARLVDLEDLATDALRRMSDRYPGLPTRLHDSALRVLSEYCWPGNVSELQAVIGQAAILSTGSVITGESIQATLGQRGYQPGALHGRSGGSGEPASSGGEPKRPLSIDLNAMQREVTTQAYRDNDRNLARTARALGLPRTTLRDRLRRYGEL